MSRIRVAVTGAAGQIGSVLVRRMLEIPYVETIAICRNSISAGIIHSFSPNSDIRIGTITEVDSVKKMLGDVDIIVNCALAMVSGKPKRSRLLNKAMVESLCQIERLNTLIHLSSISVYGRIINSDRSTKSTFEKPKPDSDYGKSKLYIEQYAKRMCISKNLKYYILRLGHVIGPKMDRSRQIFELAETPKFQLPFNGEVPSNTIHVERLAAMIISLFHSSLPSGIYNVSDEKKTWRQVFDWHTHTAELPPVKGMTKELSEHMMVIYNSASIIHDIGSWYHSLPILSLVRYPSIFDYLYRLIAIAPESIANRLATIYKCKDVKRQIAAITNNGNEMTGLEYVFNAMPGKYLRIPTETRYNYPSSNELSDQLRRWYERFSQPRFLPNSSLE